jgi:hypothetical protein
MGKVLLLTSATYSCQGIFDYNNNLEVWQFRGVQGIGGGIDDEETVIAKKVLVTEIGSALRSLNESGPPKANMPSSTEERGATLQDRMQQYNEEFQMLGTVTIEEFDVRMTINWVNESYKGEVDCDEETTEKVFAKQKSRQGGNQKKVILLECGKDKNKVIPLAIEQAKKFSFWIATL